MKPRGLPPFGQMRVRVEGEMVPVSRRTALAAPLRPEPRPTVCRAERENAAKPPCPRPPAGPPELRTHFAAPRLLGGSALSAIVGSGPALTAAPLLLGAASRARLRLVLARSPLGPAAAFPAARRILSATPGKGDVETAARILTALHPTAALPYGPGRLGPLHAWNAAAVVLAREEQR